VAAEPVVPRRPRWRQEARAFAELLALCAFAITQPLLDLFGKGVEQFALRGASPMQIVVFALGVALLPALGLWMLEVAVSVFGPQPRRAVHLAAIALLVAATVVQAARPLVTGPVLLALAAAVGGIAIFVYLRATTVAQTWLALAALAPVAYVGLFLFASPTADLLHDDTPAAAVDVGAPAPVVMLVLDELPLESLIDPDGTIDADLYPNLAALAGDSHWFRNATTVAPATWHAVPAILTGRYPTAGTSPIAADHPESLFTLLGGAYDLNVIESISRMCPTSLCPPRAEGASVWRGLVGDTVRVMRSRLSMHRSADDPVTGFAELEDRNPDEGASVFGDLDVAQPQRFQELLDGLENDPTSLHYLHILLPHVPYRFLPSGVTYPGPTPDVGRSNIVHDKWDPQAWPARLGRQRHLLQLGYVDQLVGVLTAELRRIGMYDDSLIVVTADHGISFEPGQAIRSIEGQPLTAETTPDVLWVPLFVKEPGQQTGDVSDANVLSVDVLPTIADVLDVDLPWAVDGRSALGPPRSTTEKPFYGNDVSSGAVAVLRTVDVDGPRFWPSVLERSAGAFLPPPGDLDRRWRIGPHADLVGTPAAQVAPGRIEPRDATLIEPERFDDVVGGGERPLLVRGHLPGAGTDAPVAVAVNGVIAATGSTYGDIGGAAFAMVFDDRYLVTGHNDVQLYLIR
jgi:hypothetical protein